MLVFDLPAYPFLSTQSGEPQTDNTSTSSQGYRIESSPLKPFLCVVSDLLLNFLRVIFLVMAGSFPMDSCPDVFPPFALRAHVQISVLFFMSPEGWYF